MVTIVDAINDAITLSRRPDKRGVGIILANQAVSKFVRRTTWPFDRKEVKLIFDDPTSYIQNVSITQQLPLFRKMNYLKSSLNFIFTEMDPSMIINNCGQEYLPSYYQSGMTLILKDTSPVDNVMVGYYVQPPRLVEIPTSSDQFNTHWSLDVAYDAIVFAIMSEIFAATGDDKSYGIYENKWQVEAAIAARDYRDNK